LFYLLFSGIVKLVLIGPTKALLDTTVRPQSFHGPKQFFGEWLSVFHSRYHIDYHFCIRLQTTSNILLEICHDKVLTMILLLTLIDHTSSLQLFSISYRYSNYIIIVQIMPNYLIWSDNFLQCFDTCSGIRKGIKSVIQELSSCWDGQMCQSKMGQKVWGAAVPLSVGSWVPSNTMSPQQRPTSTPSGILMHPAIWPQ